MPFSHSLDIVICRQLGFFFSVFSHVLHGLYIIVRSTYIVVMYIVTGNLTTARREGKGVPHLRAFSQADSLRHFSTYVHYHD